jgi:hypothetical protein
MKWVAFFLLFLTLAAGCVLEDKPVIPEDGGVEAGVCGICPLNRPICNDDFQCVECTADDAGFCRGDTPVCKTDAFNCVQCNASSDCNDPDAARCNTETNACERCQGESDCIGIDGLPRCEAGTCVECNANSDCNDPGAARCNTETNACERCQGESDCIGIDGLSICEVGTCVECTPGTEAITCPNGDSCNPITNECSGIQEGSRLTCQLCVSDRDCGEDGNRCVLMTYQDAPYPDAQTGFCLKTFSSGDPCERPYLVPLLGRESLSGPPEANFCGIDEVNVTCPAVLAFLSNVECLSGEDSECPESGLCEDFVDGVAEDRCTYLCTDADQCKDPPVAGSTCGVGSGGSGGYDYCGG